MWKKSITLLKKCYPNLVLECVSKTRVCLKRVINLAPDDSVSAEKTHFQLFVAEIGYSSFWKGVVGSMPHADK